MIVFVCSPYAGDIERNAENARRFCRMEYERGNTPVAPHLLFPQFVSEETERFDAIQMGLELLERCDELHAYGEVISPGMQMEIEHAESCGIPVVYGV